jgi:ribonuclease Z
MNDKFHDAIGSVTAGPYTVRGVSVGGVYTTLQVPELNVLLDAGIPLRSFAATDRIFLSHGHADHIGGLITMLGIRGMMQKSAPARVFLPREIESDMRELLAASARIQRFAQHVELVPMQPGDEVALGNGLWVHAFRAHHRVPCLGYQFVRRVQKLRSAFRGMAGAEIARRKEAGEDLFEQRDHLELCYATDTLARVLDTHPALLESRVLVLECTFYDERKSLADSRAGCHIHFDELLEHSARFQNAHLVLMHTSQIYTPNEAREILARRLPASLLERTQLLLPARGHFI